ncbi:MAG: hypothetical protein SGI83_13325 [Bacteroidota bacterium]|nr:hypothetical protein [Bacteroidota bacterium]
MENFLHFLSDWSEIWALLIPLAFMLRYKNKYAYLKPVKGYIWVALLLNTAATLLWKFKVNLGFREGDFFWSNNFFYNIHSIARLLFFSWFFILLHQPFLVRLKKAIPLLFIVFVLVNFIFFEDFFYYWSFSGRLLSLETGLLLIYCLQYYFFVLREDHSEDKRPPSFWVVTGLSIYAVVNFPIFLFYMAFVKQFENFAINIWDVTNMAFTLFCIFLAKAFYESKH